MTNQTDSNASTTGDTDAEPLSELHGKHEQALVSAYKDADWLHNTLDGALYLSVPSHLTRVRDTLETVLIEQELLEHSLACEHCGYTDYRSVKRTAVPDCPNCTVQLDIQRTEPSKKRTHTTDIGTESSSNRVVGGDE